MSSSSVVTPLTSVDTTADGSVFKIAPIQDDSGGDTALQFAPDPKKQISLKEDEICDDWEQLDQQKIEKSLQSIKLVNSSANRINEDEEKIQTNSTKNTSTTTTPFSTNSSASNNQFQSQQPIKILKRPPSNKKLNELANSNQTNPAAPPIKTFEQREHEYAQARLRILGSAHPEEETTNNNTQSSVNNTQSSYPMNVNSAQSSNQNNFINPKFSQQQHIMHQQQQQQHMMQQQMQQANSNQSNNNYYQLLSRPNMPNVPNINSLNMPNMGFYDPSSNKNMGYVSNANHVNNNSNKPFVNLVRDPMAPDGTRGFRGGNNSNFNNNNVNPTNNNTNNSSSLVNNSNNNNFYKKN